MGYTGIVQRVSSIATCNVKDLMLVLVESLEKVTHFEELSSKLVRPEGIFNYCKEFGNRSDIAEYYELNFTKITEGMTIDELDMEVQNFLGAPSLGERFMWGQGRWRLRSADNRKRFLEHYSKKIDKLRLALDKVIIEMNESAAMLIPPDYRYPLALTTMLGFVKNLRASTWKECADLYEQQLHRWKIETNSAENLQLQREIRNLTNTAANSAKAAAIFSGLNLLLR